MYTITATTGTIPVSQAHTTLPHTHSPKFDMSSQCGLQYEKLWKAAHISNTLSYDEWKEWFNSHCAKCIYMHETCMFGE